MKSILITLAFGLVMAAQPYGGRPGYGPTNRDDRGGYMNRGGNGFIDRIARGERMGLITRREAAKLYDMERDLRYETERAFRSGFGMSGRERDRIESMRARLDREITRQMRDGERYYRGDRGRW
jgi:hypothetical protein